MRGTVGCDVGATQPRCIPFFLFGGGANKRGAAPSEGRAAARWRAAVTEARREAAAAAAAAAEAAAAAAAARTAAPSCLGERSGGRRRSSSLLSAFEPGIPCHCDRRARERRSRARRIHDARAIFAESGPQREAVFSADVQRRARKQAQRRRCRAAWASRVQWRGAAGSDVHRVAPRARRSARAGQEALGRLKRTSALIAGGAGRGGIPLVFPTRLPTYKSTVILFSWRSETLASRGHIVAASPGNPSCDRVAASPGTPRATTSSPPRCFSRR